MRRFEIGSYTYFASRDWLPLFDNCSLIKNSDSAHRSDMDDRVRSYDHMLHQSLDKIFRERCLSSSGQNEEFLRGPRLKSILKPTLDQEPFLSRHFSNEEMGKLSLLWIAVLCCYEKSAELLVRSGADVNELFGRRDPQVIDENWTIIHVLLEMDPSPENEQLIRLVIEQGADLQAQDCRGRTVLHYAVINDRVQITELLLEKGADVNDADNAGMTPLLFAASADKANELVPLLMKHEADVFAKNLKRENILHRLIRAPGDHSVDLARVFIEEGVLLDDRDHIQNQPIHWAAKYAHNELVKLYLDHGADVNALGNEGKSPLHWAAQLSNNALLETLLKRGANIDLRTVGPYIEGRTALHIACQCAQYSTDEGKSEITIRLLLSAGADVLAEDKNGNTPLVLVSSRRDEKPPGDESWPLIEALALKKAIQPSIDLEDERIIERYPNLRNYYRKCTEEIDKMKCTRFIESCTFFELFTKSQCRIAELMQNPEFETKFKQFDLNDEFFIYAQDIVRAFERALNHYNSLLDQADLINEAVYNTLPYVVVKKVVHYVFNCC